jgi:hypothetical protein
MAVSTWEATYFTRGIMPNASSLEQLVAALRTSAATGAAPEKRLPPVEIWNPTHCGDAGLEILSDGTWLHEGVRITRESLVRLFASILRKDADGETYLVTPVEKIRIRVHDAPFLAIRADRCGAGRDQSIVFSTNVGDIVVAGPERPIRVTYRNGEPRPYVLVRGRLEARVLRAPFYELAEWSEGRDGKLGVWSGGAWFELGAP